MYKTTLRKTDGTDYTVDTYNGLTEQTTTTQSTHAPKEIFYGGVPKTGSMKIDDPQREIVNKVLDGTFDLSDTTVKTYYNDKLQGVFKTSDSDYEENSGELSVSLVDNISNWDKIQFAGRDYSLRADDAIKPNLYEILSYVLITTLKWDKSNTVMQADVDAMCSRTISVNMGAVIKDMTVKQFLQRIIIPYDYLAADNLRSTVDKICTVAQLNYSETNESGGVYPKNIRFFNARPAKAKSEKAIAILPTNQNTFPIRDVLLKNKQLGVSLHSNLVNINKYSDTDVFTYRTALFPGITNYDKIAEAKNENETIYGSYLYHVYYGTKMFVTMSYVSFSFKFPKLFDNNLTKINNVPAGVDATETPYISFVVECSRGRGYCTASNISHNALSKTDVNRLYTTYTTERLSIGESFSETVTNNYVQNEVIVNHYSQKVELSFNYSNIAGNTDNSPAYTITEDDDFYYVNNLILPVGYTKYVLYSCGLWGESTTVGEVKYNCPADWAGFCENVSPLNIEIKLRGTKTTIAFDDAIAAFGSTGTTTIEGNQLLQDKAFFASTYIDNQAESKNNVSLSTAQLNALYGDDGESLWSLYSFDPETGIYKTLGTGTSLNNLTVGIKYYGKRNYDRGIDEVTITSGNATNGYILSITSHYVSYDKIGSVVDRLSNSILSDYANGVSTCTTEITLDQLKYTDGTIAKQASDGEILHIGDVVRLDRNSFGDSMYNYADGNPYLWRITGTTLIYDGYPHQKLELQEITSGNRGLKYMSWEMIESIANSGQAQNVFSIGDEKEIELSTGEKLTAVIIGFNHDKISDTKKAGITFFIKTPLATLYRMNSTTTPNGGVWNNCSMYETLNGDTSSVFQKLPDDLRGKVKPVEKVFFDRANASHTSQDKLFLLSAAELGYTTDYAYGVEGTQYEYFKTEENKILYDSDNITVNWWTRSCSNKLTGSGASGVSGSFLYSSKTARCLSLTATYFLRVAFAFCIGEVDA
nr:MAG TPA: hypothetical protein [Caudoviricetes sp.]